MIQISRQWTPEECSFIKKNTKLTNQELAAELGRSVASIENKVRELGVPRRFQKHEIELLKKVWGKKRKTIERTLPRFTWRQISKKANRLGLPPLKDMRESVNLYSIINAMGVSNKVASVWKNSGLVVMNDKGSKMKGNILYVDIDHFWDFAMSHTDIVDLTRIGERTFDVLGEPPPELIEIKKSAIPIKSRINHKYLTGQRRTELAKLYYSNAVSIENLMTSFDVSRDTIRHVASQYRQPGQKRDVTTVVTEQFLKKLNILYYIEGKTRSECKGILGCSISSIDRGIKKLVSMPIKDKQKR